VQQPALAAVDQDLLVNVQEYLRRQRLDLKAGLIGDVAGAADVAIVLAAEAIVEKAAFFRERLLAGGDLREEDVGILPADDVPRPRDADNDLVVLAADAALGEDLEKLGMKGPAVQVKMQVADPRPEYLHTHDQTRPRLFLRTVRLTFQPNYRSRAAASQCDSWGRSNEIGLVPADFGK